MVEDLEENMLRYSEEGSFDIQPQLLAFRACLVVGHGVQATRAHEEARVQAQYSTKMLTMLATDNATTPIFEFTMASVFTTSSRPTGPDIGISVIDFR